MKKNMLEKKVGMLLVLHWAVSVLGSAGIASSQEGKCSRNRETADVTDHETAGGGRRHRHARGRPVLELSSSDVNRITCQANSRTCLLQGDGDHGQV
jgi:predicted secreted protein